MCFWEVCAKLEFVRSGRRVFGDDWEGESVGRWNVWGSERRSFGSDWEELVREVCRAFNERSGKFFLCGTDGMAHLGRSVLSRTDASCAMCNRDGTAHGLPVPYAENRSGHPEDQL